IKVVPRCLLLRAGTTGVGPTFTSSRPTALPRKAGASNHFADTSPVRLLALAKRVPHDGSFPACSGCAQRLKGLPTEDASDFGTSEYLQVYARYTHGCRSRWSAAELRGCLSLHSIAGPTLNARRSRAARGQTEGIHSTRLAGRKSGQPSRMLSSRSGSTQHGPDGRRYHRGQT